MNQQDFMGALKSALEENGVEKISDIIQDYQEHFTHGKQKGKSEEEIALKLGNPRQIARAYQTELLITKVKNPNTNFSFSAALTVLGKLIIIAPFNFFVFLLPGTIVFSLLAAGWAVGLGIGTSSLAILGFGITAGIMSLSAWMTIATGSAGLGLLCLGLWSLLVMFYLTKYTLLGLINYLQWNLKFILAK